jgi:hypothetical protein
MSASLFTYFALTYLLSWGIWFPLALTGLSNQWLFWLAGFAPSISALALTAFQGGRNSLRCKWTGYHRILPLKNRLHAPNERAIIVQVPRFFTTSL